MPAKALPVLMSHILAQFKNKVPIQLQSPYIIWKISKGAGNHGNRRNH